MEISVTLSANAGVALDIGGRRIWVDALHDKKEKSFSTLSPQLQQKMLTTEAFYRPEYICYTHCHGDHYSENLTQTAMNLWPDAKLLSPETMEGGEYRVEDRGLVLRFVRLPHEGEQFADVKHYGLMVSFRGYNILIPGDCALASPELTKMVGNLHLHLVLLDFPWATLRRGREYVLEHFRDSRVILYHIPFAEDDVDGFRTAAQHAAEEMTTVKDIRLLQDPLQTERFIV